MNLFNLSVVGSIAGTSLSVIIYLYLYYIYRERYIGIWVLSWICYFFRLVILDSTFDFWQNNVNYFAHLFISIANPLLFAWGMHLFVGRKMQRWWIYLGVIATILSYFAVLSNASFTLKTLTAALPFGAIYIWTGMMFFRYVEANSLGKWITGCSLILLGMHGIDFAFLRDVDWFAPWGYLIDCSLRTAIAIGTILVYFDKTRRELAQREESYRLLAENALDVIFRYQLKPSPRFEYISPSIAATTGYLPEEYYANPNLMASIVHKDDQETFKNFLCAPDSPDKQSLTVRLLRKFDQKQIWVEQNSVPIYNKTGEVQAIEGVIRDITLRKKMEQEMLRFERLNTIGQMAANLAHEIRNPMTTVRGYLQFLSSKEEYVKHRGQFNLMMEELDRANAIIREYLAMSRDKVSDFKVCQLNIIIETLFPLVQADANASMIAIELDLQEIPDIYLDENELRQVILNLVRNGLEAMASGGTLTLHTFVKEGNVVMAVQDQGVGIPPHILENLGTPFITSKEMGTGLGVPMCYKIAQRHQATMTFDTSSQGTTVSMHFPIDRQLAES